MASERLNLQLGKGKTPEEVFVEQTKRSIQNKTRSSILEDYQFVRSQPPQPPAPVRHQPPERKLLDLSSPIIKEEVVKEVIEEEVVEYDDNKFESLFSQLNELVPGFTEVEEITEELVEETISEVVEEPEVEEPEVEEAEPENYVERLARGLSEYTKRTPVANPEPKSDVDQKFELMEYQITKLKSYINEALGGMGGRDLVSGIGQGGDGQTPGGGAVQLWDLDDVAIGTPGPSDSYPELSEGDTLVWNSTLRKWEPGAGIGGVDIDFNSLKEGDVLTYDASANKWMARDGILSGTVPEQSSIRSLANKIESTDKLLYQVLDQLNSIHAVKVEENSVPDNTFYPGLGDDLIDTIPDGDTTTFIVTEDTAMDVYRLDDAPQPTVQVPRGDIIIFDLNALSDPTKFDVYQNGIILQNGRHYFSDTKLLRIRTGDIPINIDKLFYRNTEKRGMGWIISITDN